MDPNDTPPELLIRHLDGTLQTEEHRRVEHQLRTRPEARAFLRELAEQAVMVGDVERVTREPGPAWHPREHRDILPRRRRLRPGFGVWPWGLAAAAMVTLLAVAGLLPPRTPWMARVSKLTGPNLCFGAGGELVNDLTTGVPLVAGDTLETSSCDAWIQLDLRDGTKLTVAGHSTLRLLDDRSGRPRFILLAGNAWFSPGPGKNPLTVVIETPALLLAAKGAQFDIQTSDTDSLVRVNQGAAQVTRRLDAAEVNVAAEHQVIVSLSRREPFEALPQPRPITHWAGNLERVPEVILGRWLPPDAAERARLGAAPLLWPIPDREPVMLYAVALSVSSSTERPVLLQAGSRLRFRGRTERPQTVRFGFSTQKMRGVFAGKFEIDVRPESLGPAGQTWEVNLPLPDFRPLQPELAFSSDGLELTDVYALTIQVDAALEINHIELLPPEEPVP